MASTVHAVALLLVLVVVALELVRLRLLPPHLVAVAVVDQGQQSLLAVGAVDCEFSNLV